MEKSKYIYITYISSTPEKVWNALTDPKITVKYWQHENLSDWKKGSRWEHRRMGVDQHIDMVGKVLENKRPKHLVISWVSPDEEKQTEKTSRVSFDIESFMGVVRLTITHDELEPGSDMLNGIKDGWPKVISSLKSLLETGKPLPQLWEEHKEEVA